jgi:hypothetical protein
MFKPLLAAGLTVTASLPGHVFIELRDQDNALIALARLPVEHVDLLIGQIELARGHIEAGTERPSGAIH